MINKTLEGNDIVRPPDRYGFDSWLVTHSGSQSPIYKEQFETKKHGVTRSSDWIVEDAINFLEEHKNDGKPFYLNLWTAVSHSPINPTPEELSPYGNLKANPKDFSSWMESYADSAGNFTSQMKAFCAAMTSLYAAAGKLLDYLNKTGLFQNTLIFYTSDNGPEDYNAGDSYNAGVGSPGIFRDRKHSMYEGGIRVPCAVRGPGHVSAEKVSDAVWSAVDWMPTLAAIIGLDLPTNLKPNGENISDIFGGSDCARKKPIFWEWKFYVAGNTEYHPPQLAIREENWKLLCNPDGNSVELYNIADDPAEMKNIACKKPTVVKKLQTILLAWEKTIPDSAYRNEEKLC